MKCPNCGSLNSDNAKFCKRCGISLQQNVTNEVNKNTNVNNASESNNNILIVCVAAVICVLIVAGAVIALNMNNNDDTEVTPVNNSNTVANVTPASDPIYDMTILGGSFSTGSSPSDKTIANIYLGKEYSGEKVKITALWSYDGEQLNDGNILTKTVDGNGYVHFNSLNALDYYPDHAKVKLFDLNGDIIDTKDVILTPGPGTQTF